MSEFINAETSLDGFVAEIDAVNFTQLDGMDNNTPEFIPNIETQLPTEATVTTQDIQEDFEVKVPDVISPEFPPPTQTHHFDVSKAVEKTETNFEKTDYKAPILDNHPQPEYKSDYPILPELNVKNNSVEPMTINNENLSITNDHVEPRTDSVEKLIPISLDYEIPSPKILQLPDTTIPETVSTNYINNEDVDIVQKVYKNLDNQSVVPNYRNNEVVSKVPHYEDIRRASNIPSYSQLTPEANTPSYNQLVPESTTKDYEPLSISSETPDYSVVSPSLPPVDNESIAAENITQSNEEISYPIAAVKEYGAIETVPYAPNYKDTHLPPLDNKEFPEETINFEQPNYSDVETKLPDFNYDTTLPQPKEAPIFGQNFAETQTPVYNQLPPMENSGPNFNVVNPETIVPDYPAINISLPPAPDYNQTIASILEQTQQVANTPVAKITKYDYTGVIPRIIEIEDEDLEKMVNDNVENMMVNDAVGGFDPDSIFDVFNCGGEVQ
jgi:hypothetical protein